MNSTIEHTSLTSRKTALLTRYATHKSTVNNVKGAYLVGINGKKVFGKDDAVSMLWQLHDERAENSELERAIQRKLSSAET